MNEGLALMQMLRWRNSGSEVVICTMKDAGAFVSRDAVVRTSGLTGTLCRLLRILTAGSG